MPLTVTVGFSQKLGQPDYGSLGASCQVESELDGSLLDHDPDTFQTKIREMYAACAHAVQDELTRRQAEEFHNSPAPENGSRKATKESKSSATPATHNGAPDHRASSRQIDYLKQLARQIPTVGARQLESLAQRVCSKPLASLSSFDASTLIDTLKAVKEGRLDVEAALQGEGR
jgi:hypothetical protein